MIGHGWRFFPPSFPDHTMSDDRYNFAMQAARQILERLSCPPELDSRNRLPEIACFVLGAINQAESNQAEPDSGQRVSRGRKSRLRRRR